MGVDQVIIYVAHPLRGRTGSPEEIKSNTAAITAIMQQLVRAFPEHLFLSPIHAFSFLSPHGDQETPLALCKRMLKACDEVWFFGDFLESGGCMMELRWALQKRIPVYIPARIDCLDEAMRRLA